MQISVGEISKFLNGKVEGDPNIIINGVSPIDKGKPGTISFFSNTKYEAFIYNTKSAALLMGDDFVASGNISTTVIRVPNVYEALAKLIDQFSNEFEVEYSISDQCVIAKTVKLSQNISIGHFTVIEDHVEIESEVQIGSNVFIGKGSKIGKGTILKSGVKVMHETQIGKSCIIHANTVIGADGFGFAKLESGEYMKIKQLGNVVIHDDVEIGANCSIDRATFGSTEICEGAKLDNLIQVAHNVIIGRYTVIAAQTGIAGSSKIGEECRIGGQVGIAGHIEIADGVEIQAQTGVQSNVKEKNARLFGSPALDYKSYLRSYALFKRLPQLFDQISKLSKNIP